MHEYSLVQALISRVEDEARGRKATEVRAVVVRVGELAGVEPDLLAGAWEIASPGTLCAGAELRITRVPAAWACPRCRAVLAPGAVLRCPACDVPAELAEGGDALLLDSIEMEVGD